LVQVTVIRLVGYREWTESLGPDREHIIQLTQAKLHEALVRAFSGLGAFAHPARYDYMVAITNGLSGEEIGTAVNEVRKVSPVPVFSGTAAAESPREAERLAFKLALDNTVRNISVVDEEVAMAHIDLVNSTEMTLETSGYGVYEYVWSIMSQVRISISSLGGLVFYLGGDNMVAVLGSNPNLMELEGMAKLLRVRVGVGIARRSREAMKLATEALDELRSSNKLVLVVRE